MLSSKKSILFIFLISLILVTIWFGDGKLIAGGEESFSIFNSRNILNINDYWQEIGTGVVNPTNFGRVPVSLFWHFFTVLGIPLWVTQSIFYFILIFNSGIGVYYLTKILLITKKKELLVPPVASIFYILNLYTMSQILVRFLYTSMVAWSMLPWFLLCWYLYIKQGGNKYLFYFILISTFSSIAFMQPAFIFTFIFPTIIFFLILLSSDKNKIILVKRVFIALFIWLIINFWWYYPVIVLGKSTFIGRGGFKASFDSLVGVSQYFPTKQILLLRQKYLFGKESQWFNYYNQSYIYLLSIIAGFITFIGVVVGRKNKNYIYLLSLIFLGWIICKGTNLPFGKEFFNFLFSKYIFFVSLRNPYEKFGIVWLLPYSIFFALGINYLKNKFRLNFTLIGILLILFCGVLVKPIWTKEAFFSKKVIIPYYYLEANEYINKDENDNRILLLPIIPGEAATYTWNYSGIEPSQYIFDKPSVSMIFGSSYFDSKYLDLHKKFIEKNDISQTLSEMNIRYLILNRDLIAKERGAISAEETESIIKDNKNISFIKSFGNLDLYKFDLLEDNGLFTTIGENRPDISYIRYSPRKYSVKINNATENFILIFKETYHNNWIAKIGDKELNGHKLVYDYANYWEIDKSGSYTINIRFKVWPWE